MEQCYDLRTAVQRNSHYKVEAIKCKANKKMPLIILFFNNGKLRNASMNIYKHDKQQVV